jgi:O-antigen/teichoic acid export membrane protein
MTWTGVGTAVAQGCNAALVPVLARLYSPAEFGVLTVVQSLAGLGAPFAGLRYEFAIVLARSNRMAAALVLTQMLLALSFTAAVAMSLFVASSIFGATLASAGAWIWAVPVLIALASLTQALTLYLTRAGAFKQLGLMRIIQAALSSGLPLLGLFRTAGAGGLIGAAIAGGAISLVAPARLLIASAGRHLVRAANPKTLLRAARAHFRFPLYSMPYGMVNAFRERGILLCFAAFATTDVAGLLAIAMRLSFFPATFLASALGPVLYREAVQHLDDPERLRPTLRRTMRVLSLCLTPPAVLLILFGETVFVMLLGEAWRMSGRYASMLAVPALTLVLSGLFDRLFDARNRQKTALAIEVVYSAVVLTVTVGALLLGASTATAVGWFSALTVIYHLVWVVLACLAWKFPMRELSMIGLVIVVVAIATWMSANIVSWAVAQWE